MGRRKKIKKKSEEKTEETPPLEKIETPEKPVKKRKRGRPPKKPKTDEAEKIIIPDQANIRILPPKTVTTAPDMGLPVETQVNLRKYSAETWGEIWGMLNSVFQAIGAPPLSDLEKKALGETTANIIQVEEKPITIGGELPLIMALIGVFGSRIPFFANFINKLRHKKAKPESKEGKREGKENEG